MSCFSDVCSPSVDETEQTTIIAEAFVNTTEHESSGNSSFLSFTLPSSCSTPHTAKKRKADSKTETNQPETVTQEMLMKKQYAVLSGQEEKIKWEIEKLKLEVRRLQQWEIQDNDAVMALAAVHQ